METAQVNARLGAQIKREGDATLARFGASATDAIRALWGYLASAKRLPDFMVQDSPVVEASPRPAQATQGAGLALSLAREGGLSTRGIRDLSYQELRDLAFEEMIEEGRARA